MTKCEWIIASLRDGWNEMAVRNGILETNLAGSAKLLLLGLVSHNDGTPLRAAKVGVRRLAELASCNKDTAAAWLRRLAAEGWVDLTPAPANRTPEVSLVRLPDALRARLVSEQKGHGGQSRCPNRGDTVSEQRGHGGQSRCPNRGDTVSEQRGHGESMSVSGLAESVSGLRGRGVRVEASGVRTEGTEEKKRSEEREEREDIALAPPAATPSARPPRRAPAKRSLPDDWQPSAQHEARALELGVSLEREACAYRDHAEATGRRLVSWDAGFRQWLAKAAEFAERGSKRGPVQPNTGALRKEDYETV